MAIVNHRDVVGLEVMNGKDEGATQRALCSGNVTSFLSSEALTVSQDLGLDQNTFLL